ncbi:NTP transferase domain-containing protein [Anaerovoracaceae bacterium SGI.195]
MNRQEADILKNIYLRGYTTQRIISTETGLSLGSVNKSLKSLEAQNIITEKGELSKDAKTIIENSKPKSGIILAAGLGMRMVPINTQMSKGLLEINKEPLVERIIKQLREAGVNDIYVVVGFMKEGYDYLVDEYNVKIIINDKYREYNNIYSLYLAKEHIGNTYIVPCDVWCKDNPFNKIELYSWYTIFDEPFEDSRLRVNRKMEIVRNQTYERGAKPFGIAYVSLEESDKVKKALENSLKIKSKKQSFFWEDCLYEKNKFILPAKIVSEESNVEINTYEQLREIDENSENLKTEAIEIIALRLNVNPMEIENIRILKKGMTNRSFLFSVRGRDYIMRIPGEGTSRLIDRKSEAQVYDAIANLNVSDKVIYINPNNGYKITEYIHNVRNCNTHSYDDLKVCMGKLKTLHEKELKIEHTFDLFKNIDYYESLWNGRRSAFRDYYSTKAKVFQLKEFIDNNTKQYSLTHIDPVCDNFLIDQNDEVYLIDWEYAGMQDPLVDIAMFAIYAKYSREEIDNLMDIYFNGKTKPKDKIKIYCYVSVCGLLWSNWCEYKRIHGVEFGEYAMRQYRYAKDYYKIAIKEMDKVNA